MIMPGRSLRGSDGYRYGFNGKELDRDPEGMGGGGSTYDYGFRIYNPNIARFLSVDPLTKKYAGLTPYQFASNSPVSGVDLDGLEYYYAADGKLIGRIGLSTEVRLVNANNVESIKGFMMESGHGVMTPAYITSRSNEANKLSGSLNISNDKLVAFASVIHTESSGDKEESYAIGNVTMNFIDEGGSSKLKTLDDVTMYDNTFAQGAQQSEYTSFKNKSPEDQNSKFSLGAAINALGYSQDLPGFTDVSGGADSWDGIDLVSSKWKNSHRSYSWSKDSKDLLDKYKKDNKGGVDISKWTFKETGYQIRATKIIGKTLFTNIQGGRGEKKQSQTKFK